MINSYPISQGSITHEIGYLIILHPSLEWSKLGLRNNHRDISFNSRYKDDLYRTAFLVKKINQNKTQKPKKKNQTLLYIQFNILHFLNYFTRKFANAFANCDYTLPKAKIPIIIWGLFCFAKYISLNVPDSHCRSREILLVFITCTVSKRNSNALLTDRWMLFWKA